MTRTSSSPAAPRTGVGVRRRRGPGAAFAVLAASTRFESAPAQRCRKREQARARRSRHTAAPPSTFASHHAVSMMHAANQAGPGRASGAVRSASGEPAQALRRRHGYAQYRRPPVQEGRVSLRPNARATLSPCERRKAMSFLGPPRPLFSGSPALNPPNDGVVPSFTRGQRLRPRDPPQGAPPGPDQPLERRRNPREHVRADLARRAARSHSAVHRRADRGVAPRCVVIDVAGRERSRARRAAVEFGVQRRGGGARVRDAAPVHHRDRGRGGPEHRAGRADGDRQVVEPGARECGLAVRDRARHGAATGGVGILGDHRARDPHATLVRAGGVRSAAEGEIAREAAGRSSSWSGLCGKRGASSTTS